MEKAEVAMKPMPHDDSEDVDILSYLRSVQSAVVSNIVIDLRTGRPIARRSQLKKLWTMP